MIKQNLYWIDAIKGICMLCVYLCHSEIYYSTDSLGLGYWVKPFYVNAFFFISGYLFFGKWLIHSKLTDINGGGTRMPLKIYSSASFYQPFCFLPSFTYPRSLFMQAVLA